MKFNRIASKVLHNTEKKLKRRARRYAKKTFLVGVEYVKRSRRPWQLGSRSRYDYYKHIKLRRATIGGHINWKESKEGVALWKEVYCKVHEIYGKYEKI